MFFLGLTNPALSDPTRRGFFILKIMIGWVKVHRKLIEWEWFNDSKMVHLFMYLLVSANHKDGNFQGQEVKRGQFITGRNKISSITGISNQSIRTCLKRLESTNEITIKSTNKNSLITLLRYDLYQSEETTNQQPNKQITNDQPATNQQLTTNKNVKNETMKESSFTINDLHLIEKGRLGGKNYKDGLKDLYELNEYQFNLGLNEWKLMNEVTEFKDEGHLKRSLNLHMKNNSQVLKAHKQERISVSKIQNNQW